MFLEANETHLGVLAFGFVNAALDALGAQESLFEVSSDREEITIGAKPEPVTLRLVAGPAYAGCQYLVVGSMTGTKPGVNFLGVAVPLNLDVYSYLTLSLANSAVFDSSSGVLDESGKATTVVTFPGKLSAKMQSSMEAHHAFVVFAKHGEVIGASAAVPLMLHKE